LVVTTTASTGCSRCVYWPTDMYLLFNINFIFTLGERPMSIKEMEALLEATRQKLADQGRVVDARLLDKERMLEQAVIDAYLDEPVTLQDLLTEYKDNE
jgi:hypothetical protein